jgi:type IV pilus assembly protein PilN
MLRINLLPIRQLKKRAKARNQILTFATLLGFFLFILGAVAFVQNSNIETAQASITKLTTEKKSYGPILKKMKELENKKLELEVKTAKIELLQENSAITVRILDEIAKKVDSKRMWLKSLKQEGVSLVLDGVALDNRTIAQFMDALKGDPHAEPYGTPYLSTINLTNASLAKVSGRDLKSFSLNCTIGTTAVQTAKATDKQAKK